jgi:predicted phage terminase large subunit-like protein
LFIIDDPHSEQDAKLGRSDVFLPAWEWFQSGPLQRLMPGGAIIVVMTRWSKLDLTGQIVNQMIKQEGVDEWEVVEFPAIIEDKDGNEASLWPEFWPLKELLAKKAALDVRYWNSQYLQNPVSEEGALIKREWWNIWEEEDPPQCEFTIMSLDAAQEANNRADYNALTTWGVFFNEETNNYNIILLNSIKERLEFPELKEMVLREYKDWEPDAFMVEKKSNGAALYQEMRRMGLPIGEFTPGKGQDKISRVNAISDLFRSGIVWAPDRRWAKEVIEECNDFPSGANDDLVDSTTLALMRFRQGGFIRLPSDEPEDIAGFRSSRNRLYAI